MADGRMTASIPHTTVCTGIVYGGSLNYMKQWITVAQWRRLFDMSQVGKQKPRFLNVQW